MLSTEIATNLRGRALEAVLIVELKRRGADLCICVARAAERWMPWPC